MTALAPRDTPYAFKAPEKTFGEIDPLAAARLAVASGDIALVIDKQGFVRDFALGSEEFSTEDCNAWLGKRWIETVTVESRPKVEALLKDAADDAPPRLRQVNHPSLEGRDIPVRYSAVRISREGRVVAIGRDLRAMATLQQRLVEAQQLMEREYARVRQAETRYRLLFQIASEAVLIVDAASGRVSEANPAAAGLLGKAVKRLPGRSFSDLFAAERQDEAQDLLVAARTTGRADEASLLLESGLEVVVSASLFRQENAAHLLVRLSAPRNGAEAGAARAKSKLLDMIENLPDGFVVTDADRKILAANAAFLDLSQLATEEQVKGALLDRWLGRTGVDLDVLFSSLREHGSVRRFETVLRGEYGAVEEVEISAVSALNSEQPALGFSIRAAERVAPSARSSRELPRSVEQLTKLVGRVSLKELVRETTDVIERLCIEAALELTGDNRASAAEMLGLSRQSLYAKLRRYGFGDLADNEA